MAKETSAAPKERVNIVYQPSSGNVEESVLQFKRNARMLAFNVRTVYKGIFDRQMNSDCILCGAKPQSILKNLIDLEYGCEGSFSFKKCPNCGLLMLFPTPTLSELKSYYPVNYHGYHIQERGIISILYRIIYLLRFREYVSLVGRGARILEIGCADMPYLDFIKIKYPDLKITGIEFKDEVAEKGRKKGRNIITGTVSDIKQNESYDLIIMNNLIEHVIDPLGEVEKAHSLLKPGGYLFVETPNTESWDYTVANRYWGSLHVPRHTYLFSLDSIELLAKKTKFDVIKVKYLLNIVATSKIFAIDQSQQWPL